MPIFLTYIMPVLLIGGIGGVVAVLLAFLGEKMAVDRDARIDDIERFLPGANCGGCGRAGCSAMAEALFSGEASVTECGPLSPENKNNILRILELPLADSQRTVAVVHCIGGRACKDKFDYQGYGDCKSAELLAGGNKQCSLGCIGLSACVDECKYNAITVDKRTGVARVSYEYCASCGACVAECPKKIIGRIPVDAVVYVACSNTKTGKEVASVCKKGCIACGRCEKNCPTGAIALNNNLAAIDYGRCIKCGNCADVCPRKCILPFPYEKPFIET
ncbi:MAG: RnfABCDGE type electron transport complex subunit B [Clostridiales bacterium]|jgi:electron transport complex protein RnfB|nr:RnfABCDGE type electron transport complex subunit B [Clostridiales bacterium]